MSLPVSACRAKRAGEGIGSFERRRSARGYRTAPMNRRPFSSAHPVRRFAHQRGMTLVEALVAMVIASTTSLSCLLLLCAHRMQSRKALEQGIILDFAIHYLELARTKDFANVAGGKPISTLHPNITFPPNQPNNDWHSLWTEDFRAFHRDLEWLEHRDPQYRCTITPQGPIADPRSKHIRFELRWHPPLGRGREWLTVQFDTVVYPNFY